MRIVFRLVVILLMVGIAIAGGHRGISPRVMASPSNAGGTLTIAQYEEPDTLNPVTAFTSVAQIDRLIFDTLIWQKQNAAVTPDLATRWKVLNHGREYRLFLRHGVKFQDGTPFNAAAVVTNFEYIEKPSTHARSAITLLGPFQSARAIGNYEVDVKFKQPYLPFLARLGEPYLSMQSPTSIRKFGAQVGNHPSGTGPFTFVSFTPNVSVVLRRNPAYNWAPPAAGRNGPARLSKVVFDIVPESQPRVNALQSGQVQMATSMPGLWFERLQKDPRYTSLAIPVSGVGVWAAINTTRFPTNSLAVRRAILYALNKPNLIKIADQGAYHLTNGPVQQGTFGYSASFNSMYPHNVSKAASILRSAGWKKSNGVWVRGGRPLQLNITVLAAGGDYPALSVAMQGELQSFGMKVGLTTLATPAWLSANVAGKENVTVLKYDDVDPDVLRLLFVPGEYFAWSNVHNPRLTALFTKADGQVNTKARFKTYVKIEKIIMDNAYMIPIHRDEELTTMSKSVKGLLIDDGGYVSLYNATV